MNTQPLEPIDQTPASTPVSSRTFPYIPLLSFIILLLIAATAFLAYQNVQLQKQVTDMQTSPTPSPTPTPPETQVMGIRLSDCCTCPTEIPASLVGNNGWVLYETGKDYSSERPTACKAVMCKPCELLMQTPQTSPTTPTTPKQGKYTCPASGWADCMPGPGKNMSGCSPEAMAWYEVNCPNFQGGAY